MLMPKRTKYRKSHRGRIKGISKGALRIDFGEYALSAVETGFISNRQIEAARIALVRFIKRGGKVWFRIFPDYPFTKKPAETRMGKGKGNPEAWLARVKRGRILIELAGVDLETAKEAMRLASHKLCIKTQFLVRKEIEG